MFLFLVILFLSRNVQYMSSESSLLNGTTKGSDASNSGNIKVVQ